mmetsp:Transcript_2332/g.8416  ORF Transcript_2332/g.8416 Transcript_2332/m.8416 type:complete len:113 (+) Transcript_2332:119-457(+)
MRAPPHLACCLAVSRLRSYVLLDENLSACVRLNSSLAQLDKPWSQYVVPLGMDRKITSSKRSKMRSKSATFEPNVLEDAPSPGRNLGKVSVDGCLRAYRKLSLTVVGSGLPR